jgi:hypothetical protein
MGSPSSRERLGLLLGFIGMVIFGGTLPATRIAVAEIDPIALTALRTAIAGVCSLVLLLVLRRPLPPRALWPQLVIAMLCVAVLFPLLMSLGMQRVDASHGGVVLGVLPIATALVAVAATALVGCGTSGSERDAKATVQRFYAALQSHDGAAACAQLTNGARSSLQQQEKEPCAKAIVSLQLSPASPSKAQVVVTSAIVRTDKDETAFLDQTSKGWRISDAGCKKNPGQPYDCELES